MRLTSPVCGSSMTSTERASTAWNDHTRIPPILSRRFELVLRLAVTIRKPLAAIPLFTCRVCEFCETATVKHDRFIPAPLKSSSRVTLLGFRRFTARCAPRLTSETRRQLLLFLIWPYRGKALGGRSVDSEHVDSPVTRSAAERFERSR